MESITDVLKRDVIPFNVPCTCRISPHANLMLEALCDNFGKKRARLAGEILDAAIRQVYQDGLEGKFELSYSRSMAYRLHENDIKTSNE